MFRIIFLTLFSLSLHAIGYPELYSEMSGSLFKARVQFDSLTHQSSLRQPVLAYVIHSDRVLGKYRRIKADSDPIVKNAYHKALEELQKRHKALKLLIRKQLTLSIQNNQYYLFLAIVKVLKSEEDYKSPYLREKVYTFYHAHRLEGRSCYLDNRIKEEWNSIAPYYPSKGLFNYENTANAYYREVILLSTTLSPYSAKVKEFLQDNNVKFKEYDIETDDEGLQIFEKHKGTRIPMVIINNRVVEGYNEFEMDRLLRR